MNFSQGNIFSFTGTTYGLTFDSPIAAGTLVVFGVDCDTRVVADISGTNLSCVPIGANTNNPTANYNISLWAGIVTGGSCSGVTVTLNNSTADAHAGYAAFGGPNSDQSGATANGNASGPSGTHDSGSVTPPTADNVVVAAMGRGNGTWNEDTDFTQVPNGIGHFVMGYRLQSAATPQSYLATQDELNGYSWMRIGAFAGVGAGSPGPAMQQVSQPMRW